MGGVADCPPPKYATAGVRVGDLRSSDMRRDQGKARLNMQATVYTVIDNLPVINFAPGAISSFFHSLFNRLSALFSFLIK